MRGVRVLEDRVGAALAVATLAGLDAPRVDDRYRLVKVLGRGANGVVVEAHDQRLDREVALKLFAEWDDRVLREARAIAKLDHPHVIRVHDVNVGELRIPGEKPTPCAYVSMALARGSSLRSWLSARPSESRIHRVLAAAGEGLAAAHEAGLVHRDIKPENIMVDDASSREPAVWVVDFGLARPPPTDGELTTLAGTPPYMAPEAVEGVVSATGDVYAFARVAVEALRGALPTDERGLQALLEGLGGRLKGTLERALDPRPDRRPSMRKVVQALRRPRRSVAWDVLGVGLVVLFIAFRVSPTFHKWVVELIDRDPSSRGAECAEFAGDWVMVTTVTALGTAPRGLGAQGRYHLSVQPGCDVSIAKTGWRNSAARPWHGTHRVATTSSARTSAGLDVDAWFGEERHPYHFTLRFGGLDAGGFEQRNRDPAGDAASTHWRGTALLQRTDTPRP